MKLAGHERLVDRFALVANQVATRLVAPPNEEDRKGNEDKDDESCAHEL